MFFWIVAVSFKDVTEGGLSGSCALGNGARTPMDGWSEALKTFLGCGRPKPKTPQPLPIQNTTTSKPNKRRPPFRAAYLRAIYLNYPQHSKNHFRNIVRNNQLPTSQVSDLFNTDPRRPLTQNKLTALYIQQCQISEHSFDTALTSERQCAFR